MRALAVLLATAALADCGRLRAGSPAVPVVLSVPTPPARVTVPVALPDPPPPPPPETADAPPAAAPPRPPATRPADRPATAPAPPAAEAPEAPVLQTTTDVAALERRAIALLVEAQGNLDRVGYRDLGDKARAQYDSAVSFIKNARIALSVKNYMYAEQLAAKAAAVASALVKG